MRARSTRGHEDTGWLRLPPRSSDGLAEARLAAVVEAAYILEARTR